MDTAHSLTPPQKILVLKKRAMGDTVVLLPTIEALHQKFPEAQIHVATPAAWLPLLENQPGVTRTWALPKKMWRGLGLLLKLRDEKFDWTIQPHASSSTARFCRWIGSPVRSIHFHSLEKPNHFSTVEIPGKGEVKPATERDLDCIRPLLGVTKSTVPRLRLTSFEIEAADALIQTANYRPPILSLGLGASRSTKCWPVEFFVEIASQWIEKKQGCVLFVGGKGEEPLAEELMKRLGHDSAKFFHSHFGLPIRLAAAVLSQCKVHLGNDSGPKHLAVSVGTPTLTLFGPVDPFEWHPYPKDQHPYLFTEGLTCRKDAPAGYPAWCGLHECTVEQHRCMTSLRPNEVWTQLTKLAD